MAAAETSPTRQKAEEQVTAHTRDDGVAAFFRYARDRELIRLLRFDLSEPPPWSVDPIFNTYSFCNVFREDDRTTRWFRENVRDPYRDQGAVVMATIIFRWFNRIETGEALKRENLFLDWNPWQAKKALSGLPTVFTGSYVIASPTGRTKLDGIIQCIDRVWKDRAYLQKVVDEATTLEQVHRHLVQFPFLGPFMAYEIVTDLRYTAALDRATDINHWASAGPGAARGLGRILWGDHTCFGYTSQTEQRYMQTTMEDLLIDSQDERYWPQKWPRWEMREVEHTLCEFDKYERVRLNQGTLRRKFKPCTL